MTQLRIQSPVQLEAQTPYGLIFGAVLPVHDHAVPAIAARQPVHEPLRNGHAGLRAPR